MLFISSRMELSNEEQIGPDQFWDLRIRGGMVTSKRELSGLAEVQSAVAGKRILMLVHGYNNELEDVTRAYDLIENQVQRLMGNQYDLVIGYTWPAGNDRFDYFSAKTRSGALAPRFRDNLRQLHNSATRPKSLDVMGHSMGTRLIFESLKHLNTRNVIRNLINMASAVDNESIETNREYFPANGRVKNSFVFHSRHDHVLNVAYRIAEWDLALGLHGPEDPADVMQHSKHTYVVNCKRVIRSHGDYKGNDDVFEYLNANVAKPGKVQFSSL